MKKLLDVLKKLYIVFNKKQKKGFIVLCIGTFICAIFETLGVSIILPVINVLMDPEKVMNHETWGPLFSVLGVNSKGGVIAAVIIATILIYVFKDGYLCFFSWWRVRFSCKVERDLNIYMIRSYMNRGYQYFLHHNTYHFTQGITEDVFKVFQIINGIIVLFTKIFTICLIGILLLATDWKMALLIGILSVFCLILMTWIFRKRMKKVGVLEREYNRKYGQVFLQIIQGIKEILVMRKQKSMIAYYDGYRVESQKYQIKRQVGTEIPNHIIEGFFVLVIMSFLGIRMMTGENGVEFLAVLATFAVGAFRIMPALGGISSNVNSISANLPSLTSLYENLIEARSFNKSYNDVDVKDDPTCSDLEFVSEVHVNGLKFSYSEELGNVLNGIDMHIEKGTSVGIVGESGAGKSTFADVFLGLLDPTEGEILMDGISIKRIPNKWSKIISFVPQTIYLADLSIRENVAFGVPEQEIDDERVRSALSRAKILDFVETLSNGIFTEVGERGVRISGGQRQRIGIARALYTNPEILVLDEATSALDNTTENSVMEDIELLQGNITMIIIAHRLTTIRKCDVVYEIKDGKAILRDKDKLV